jgi:hypothetical protein
MHVCNERRRERERERERERDFLRQSKRGRGSIYMMQGI